MTPSGYNEWLKCHNCGKEYAMSDGVRTANGCANYECFRSDIHIHSDRDGERPTDEYVRIKSVRLSA
jgi:hypothetical protein